MPAEGPSSRLAHRSWRIVLFVGAIVAVFCAAWFTPLGTWFSEPQQISDRLHEFGPAAPLVFTLAVALLVTVGVPRLILCAAGGLAFGFVEGLLWSQIGTMIGSYGTFLFARWSGRDYLLGRFPSLARHQAALAGGGIWAVVLVRQIPATGVFINLILGITHVSHRDFLLGTAVGILPEAIPITLAGAGVAQGSLGGTTLYLSLALAAAGLVGLVLRRIVRRNRLALPGDG